MIPRAPLILGLAGLLPFAYGVARLLGGSWMPSVPGFSDDGLSILSQYGAIILSFMSGVLWGFATRSDRAGWIWYSLSVVPALWVFFTGAQISTLIVGFIGLLLLDWAYASAGLTPTWWMKLRGLLTTGVVIFLTAGLMT